MIVYSNFTNIKPKHLTSFTNSSVQVHAKNIFPYIEINANIYKSTVHVYDEYRAQ